MSIPHARAYLEPAGSVANPAMHAAREALAARRKGPS